jgi:Animal haem peroxidase
MPDINLSSQAPHSSPSPPQRFHGVLPIRGLEDVPRSALYEGRFGRMFRNLPPFAPSDADLLALAALMSETEDQADDPNLDNPDIPAGFTYFGQFIDHDITFDPNSKLQRDNDPDALRNFRTPRFDLDSLYADGPDNNPYLYDADGLHLLVGKNAANEDDLPRNAANPKRALIGDPRNDENAIVSQLHLAFIKFHNKVLDSLPANTPNLFDEARRIVRWHYQWVVVHDFLRKILGGDDVVNDIIKLEKYKVPLGSGTKDIQGALNVALKFYNYRNQPFIPVEFSVAAYRFGHSMIRTEYELNPTAQDVPIFGDDPNNDLRGFKERRAGLEIQWARFFEFSGAGLELQHSRRIDTKLAVGLSNLPFITDMFKSLAQRNLLRGKALGLPSGQAVARAMGIQAKDNVILTPPELNLPTNLATAFSENTPLWFYILKEAEVRCNGKKLGPIGGRIVAEVLIGLLDGDPASYLSAEPTWQPKQGRFGAPQDGKFFMADLLRFAGAKIS